MESAISDINVLLAYMDTQMKQGSNTMVDNNGRTYHAVRSCDLERICDK